MRDKSANLNESQARKITTWRIYLSLAMLHSLFSIFLMLNSPSSADHTVLGLSRERLFLALIILIFICIFLWILIKTWIKPKNTLDQLLQVVSKLETQPTWGIVSVLLGIGSLLGSYLLTISVGIEEQFTKAFLNRLLPIIIWATGLAILTLISLIWNKYGLSLISKHTKGKIFYVTLLIIGVILLSWTWFSKEIVPIERPQSGLNTIGAPILSVQLFLAWLSGIGILILSAISSKNRGDRKLQQRIFDMIIFLAIWFITIILWQSKPIAPNWFISDPVPPNFEFYPTSDARVYDLTSQLALVGEGIQFFVRRPVHAVFLIILHLLAGQNYEKVAFMQVVALALLPSFIYLLTKSLFNRAAGVIAAILILFREANAISLGGHITVSHAKQFMVDLPMALVVVILIYLLILWFKKIENGNLLALIAGGFLGLVMLIRLESFVFILPVMIILGILLFPAKRYSLWTKQISLFILGIILMISPWVWRNWEKTGLIYIDSPVFYQQVLSLRFKPPPKEALPAPTQGNPNDSTGNDSEPTNHQEEQALTPPPTPTNQTSLNETEDPLKFSTNKAITYLKSNFQQISAFIITHFLNSQIQTLLILPTSLQGVESVTTFLAHKSTEKLLEECCSPLYYVRNMPYWKDWDGTFPIKTLLPLTGIILMIAFGVNEGWKKQRIIGFTPIFLWAIYILFNAIFRNSGGRYILPVDWTGIVYFSIGLAYTSNTFLINTFSGIKHHNQQSDKGTPKESSQQKLPIYKILILGLFIFLIGCLIPLLEASFSQRYTPTKRDNMVSSLLESDLITSQGRKDIETFISQGGTIIAGRGLYPRYFAANEGEQGRKKGAFAPKPYPRLVFHVVGPESPNFALPLDKKPEFFPSGSDVLVFTCPELEPLAVTIFDDNNTPAAIYFRSPMPSNLTCPVTETRK